MNDVHFMKVVDAEADFFEELRSLRFFYPRVCDDIIEELTPIGVFHNQVYVTRRIYDFVHLDDVLREDRIREGRVREEKRGYEKTG